MSDLETEVLSDADAERLRRWRLVLGGSDDGTGVKLNKRDQGIDAALEALYGQQGEGSGGGRMGQGQARGQLPGGRQGGLGKSIPNVARWLGDIRKYFPASVVQVIQRDAIERLNMRRLLFEPETLESL